MNLGERRVLDEVEGAIVTRYQILEHPTEHGQAVEAVAHHRRIFEHPPRLVAGDRGVHSADTEPQLTAAGVKLVAIPAVGKLSAEQKNVQQSRRWKRGYRWRAGIEGRIASLRRITAGAEAGITGKTGWNGGSGWGSSPAICVMWPRPPSPAPNTSKPPEFHKEQQ